MLQIFKMMSRYLKETGVLGTYYRSINFIDNKVQYNRIRKKAECVQQNKDLKKDFAVMPLFSILVPVYRTPEKFLRDLIDSVQNQTYEKWELCIADGSGEDMQASEIILDAAKKDGRIRYRHLKCNGGISENTNAALEMASGDYITLLDHDDFLDKNALYSFVEVINTHDDADFIYSDEDKVSADGKTYFNPRFKPDFSIDYLCTNNYICHMVAVKTGIAKLVGGFRKEFDGSQDYDFVLRCIENSENVYHIPKILYHWRFHENSTAENPENKLYCFEAGRKAIQEYLNRNAVDAHVKQCKKLGYYRLHYNLESIKTLPSVEVIVYGNNRKHTSQQVLSVIQKSLYVSKVTDIYTQDCKEINTCVSQSAADYILFLNRDVCALSGDSIEELLGYCTRKDVAAAGSYVIGKRHRIYHTGIVVGMYGMYGYLHRGISKNYEGYYGRITMPQDMSAVDFSCTMISVESWKEEGGLDEKMPFDMACVDFCLRAGGDRLIVYNPWSKVKICRSASVREEKKKIQNMPDNAERLFKERWAAFFEGGDPHYNVNLSLKNNAYKIKA